MRSPTLLNAKSYVAMSATRRIAFAGAVALLIVLTLFTAAEEASVSDAQFNAKLKVAAEWNDAQPIYRQLKEKLLEMILDGQVAEGEAMPSVRQISVEMKINPITVIKAVQELEEQGAVEKRRGLGMFVREGAREELRAQAREDFLTREWPGIFARLSRLQIQLSDLFQGPKS
jgi:GntR family transcriptional regulator